MTIRTFLILICGRAVGKSQIKMKIPACNEPGLNKVTVSGEALKPPLKRERVTMSFYFWVIPVVLLLLIAVFVFYAVIKRKGGPGVRTSGRTVADHGAPPDQAPGGERSSAP
jgi:hypothetical protein